MSKNTALSIENFKSTAHLHGPYNGAGPGTSGFADLAIVARKDRTEIWEWNDDSCHPDISMTIPGPLDWQAIAFEIATNECCRLNGLDFDCVKIEGLESPFDELILLAWYDDETAEFVRPLTTLTTEQLLDLKEECGSLMSSDTLGCFAQISGMLSEWDAYPYGFEQVTKYFDDEPLTVMGIYTAAVRFNDAKETESEEESKFAEKRKQERETKLEAWRELLTEVEAALVVLVPYGGGSNADRFRNVVRGVMRRYIEDQIIEHGVLPRGNQRVEFELHGQSYDRNFDFEKLREIMIEQSKSEFLQKDDRS